MGAPAELYDRPVNRFVASFVGESNFLDATAVGIEADTVVAKLGARRVRAVGNGPVAAGAPLILAVRPEKLWFARHDPALPEANVNRLEAVVLDVTLVGEMYRYLLETEFGAPLTLKQQHRYGAFTPAPSEPVIVEWSAQDTLVV